MTFNTLSQNVSSFLMTKYFPILSESVGIQGCLTFMSGVCILGILFVIFVMEETNGRNLDSIGTRRPEANAFDSSNTRSV